MSKRRFNLLLLAILLVFGGLSLASYDYSLPYVDHVDEPNYYLAGLEARGLYDNEGYYDGVPPAYIALHALVQPPLESLGIDGLSATTRVMRLLALTLSLGTLILIALTARSAAGDLAGLVAGASWGLSPLVMENTAHALPDPPVYFFTALALWTATIALTHPRRRGWSLWSCAAALVAVTFKYPAVPALLLAPIPALLTLREDRGRGLLYLGLQAAMIAGVGFFLVIVYGVDFNNLQREGAEIASSGLTNLFEPSRLFNNLVQTIVPLNAIIFWLVTLAGLVAYVFVRRRAPDAFVIRPGVIGLCVVLLMSVPWLTASYAYVVAGNIRYVLPATVAACVMFGAAFAAIVALISARVPGKNVRPIALLLLLALVFLPQIPDLLALVQERRLPDQRIALRRWAEETLEPGPVIVEAANHKTFNTEWSGLGGAKWFNWTVAEDIRSRSLDDWREDALMVYAALSPEQIADLQADDSTVNPLDSMLRLRAFMGPGRGPDTVMYRLWQMDVPLDVGFGEMIRLRGHDAIPETVSPGDSIPLRLYWSADSQPARFYSLFVHLTPPDDPTQVLSQVDGPPGGEARHTVTWDQAAETIIGPVYTLPVPANIAPGRYTLRLGVYAPEDGTRLAVMSGGDAYVLATFMVDQP